jgi:hypothetical protein
MSVAQDRFVSPKIKADWRLGRFFIPPMPPCLVYFQLATQEGEMAEQIGDTVLHDYILYILHTDVNFLQLQWQMSRKT